MHGYLNPMQIWIKTNDSIHDMMGKYWKYGNRMILVIIFQLHDLPMRK